MSKKHDIVVGFDEVMRHYYIIWHPPTAIGSGRSIPEALGDLRRAIVFSLDNVTKRASKETVKEV